MTIVTFTRVLPLKLKKADSKQCFYAIQTLMAVFFEIDTCPAHYRQERLHKQLSGIVEEPLHCLFNDLFFVKVTKVIAVCASSAKTRGFHTQLDGGPETP